MARFVQRAGSQRAAAAALGVSASTVGKVIKGLRNGERYRDAARAGATGKAVTPPAPTARTPRRVRQPVRQPTRAGGSRVTTGSPRVAARQIGHTVAAGRTVSGFTVTVTSAQRAARYRHKSGGTWSGPLTLNHPTADQLEQLTGGTAADVLEVLREEYPWLGGGRISGITYED